MGYQRLWLQDGSVERWRARFRTADVLIVDDVQHLADKDYLIHGFRRSWYRLLRGECQRR